MSTLTPTVHERIARCGTQVYVDGLNTGADVEVDVGEIITNFTATGPGKNVLVASLSQGDKVRARQDAGSGFTLWSPMVTVENALVPPNAGPNMPAEVGSCSQCIRVWGCVPGSHIELIQGSIAVGSGIADRNGARCISVKLEQNEVIHGKMIVCGVDGPESVRPIVTESGLPKPELGSPLYGCQRVVPLSNLHKGSRVRLESSVSGSLGSFCTCWNAVNAWLGSPLVIGHQVRAQPYWDGDRCKQDGPWSEWEDVITPDLGITPILLEALIENDQLIRVGNQVQGADIKVYIADSDDPADIANPDVFGPRPASDEQEIALNEPLNAGMVVWVDQTLCSVTFASNQVEVLPLPPVIYAPTVLEPLYACGGKVTVIGLHAGALVRVFQDGFPIAIGWSGMANSLSLTVAPGLAIGGAVTAIQWVGGMESPVSDPVIVQELTDVHIPRILRPVTLDDHAVWVSGVTPGAKVAIYMGGLLIGESESSESIVKVETNTITGPVTAKVSFCNARQQTSEAVSPIISPCARGSWSNTGNRPEDYGTFVISDWDDGCCDRITGDPLEVPIFGELYYPAIPAGCLSPITDLKIHPDARNLPLVIIAHGYMPSSENSHLGYAYLAHHLANWGMIVYSINLKTISDQHSSTTDPPYQKARGEVILKAIESILGDAEIANHINPEFIGLIGHSMGGEAVVVAQDQNLNRANPFGIKGVVSIAPTQYRSEVSLKEAEYFQMGGSKDLLLGVGGNPIFGSDNAAYFNGMRIFGRAERNKSHAFIYGAVHNPFNTIWSTPGDEADHPVTGGQHRQIARCLINTFFQKTLLGKNEYEGYLEGLILPPTIRNIEIYQQHLRALREVLDNFGDADAQAGLGGQTLNKNSNRQTGTNDTDGMGIQTWEDVEANNSDQCIHNTKCVELSWEEPNAWYFQLGSFNMSDPVKNLSFRICQYHEDLVLNELDREIDLLIEISDGVVSAHVRMGLVGISPFPDTDGNDYSIFRSIRIPADAFEAVNQGVNMAAITEVRLKLSGRPTGHILVDDIELDN